MSKWYSINIVVENVLNFKGFFKVNTSNIIVGFYETINETTNFNNNILNTSNVLKSKPPTTYLGFQLYRFFPFAFDNAYLYSWKQFDTWGVIINSMSQLPEYNNFNLCASNIGDESITNIGNINIAIEDLVLTYEYCLFTINLVPDPTIPIPIPISDICFPKETPIVTNQGIIPIDKLTLENTIDYKKIVGITKTISQDKYLVCFKPNSLGPNIPSKETIMTKNHKIFYKGKNIKATDFENIFQGVTTVPYTGEALYNVIMENHYKMNVNNLICETLNPTSEIAKLYKYITSYPSIIETYNKNVVKHNKKCKLVFKK